MENVEFENDALLVEFVRRYIYDAGLPLNKDEGNHQSPALLRIEAKRRGWAVFQVSKTIYHFHDDVGTVGGIQGGVTSLVSGNALTTCDRKHISKVAFLSADVPTPDYSSFSGKDFERALEYFRSAAKPVVVKPSNGMMGNDLTTNVVSDEDFAGAWKRATGTPQGQILIEEQVLGLDIRSYVVGGEVVAAVSRIPAFVVGDGKSSISILLERLKAERKKNAYLRSLRITVDHRKLAEYGVSLQSILKKGDIYFLNRTSNTHQGAMHVDVTDAMSWELKALAVKAASAIPGLGAVGIDILTECLDSAEHATVLEANSGASLLLHHYPAFGASINVAQRILDQMENVVRPR